MKTSYLPKLEGSVRMTPQMVFMNCAIECHRDNLIAVKRMYDDISTGLCVPASPTLFNSMTPMQQLASCFLKTMKGRDSIEGIYDMLAKCAKTSKNSGGIGLAVHDIR